MSDEQPIKFTTPYGKDKVELKPYANGYDQELINTAVYDDPPADSPEAELTPSQRANRKSIEVFVLSINGSTEGVVGKVLAMRSPDYKAVIQKINSLEDPITPKKK